VGGLNWIAKCSITSSTVFMLVHIGIELVIQEDLTKGLSIKEGFKRVLTDAEDMCERLEVEIDQLFEIETEVASEVDIGSWGGR
jgi:hypothetical protein